MKKSSLLILLAIFLQFSCAADSYLKLKIEIPSVSPLNLELFKEIVVTNFWVEKELKDFNFSQELIDYIMLELGLEFKGKISSKSIIWEKEELFRNEDFWKTLAPDLKQTLFLTGKAEYSQEIRKAILEKEKTRFEEEFPPEKNLAERKVFTIELDLYFISSETGKILYEKNFKETQSYKNPKQSLDFAFFDLMQNVKLKFFRSLLGGEKIQERYILSK